MSRRAALVLLSLAWPTGLVLTAVNLEIAAVTLPVFLLLDVLYAGGVAALLWRLRDTLSRPAVELLLAGVGLFVLVAWAGPPTAAEPDLMQVNTAALLAVALLLLVCATRVVLGLRHSVAAPGAATVLVLLVVGTTLYLGNLVGRLAVVFSGAAAQQAAQEDTAWVAYEYLRGLPAGPDFISYLLTWLDLLQLGYVATAYVAFAGIALLLGSERQISPRAAHVIAAGGAGGATAIVLGVGLAAALPREVDAVPASVAFVASIPFMTTLLPFMLGIALIAHRSRARAGDHSPRLLTQRRLRQVEPTARGTSLRL